MVEFLHLRLSAIATVAPSRPRTCLAQRRCAGRKKVVGFSMKYPEAGWLLEVIFHAFLHYGIIWLRTGND